MKILIAGGSGLIGRPLVARLRASGYDVTTLVRRPAQRDGEVQWDPAAGLLPPSALEGVDAAVNLAGAGIGDRRWTEGYKQQLVASRVDSTKTLAEGLAQHRPTATLLQGSAIGYYGNDNGDAVLTERSPAGSDFLAELCQTWEAQARPLAEAGGRVVTLRTGLVMTPKGGSFGKLLPLFKAGLAGKLGDGQMWWSWITLPDQLGAVEFLLDTPEVVGPVNLTAPDPQPNEAVTKAIGRAMNRPTVLPVPTFALKIALGDFADDVLGSARVMPTVLQDAGYSFQHPTLASAAAYFAT